MSLLPLKTFASPDAPLFGSGGGAGPAGPTGPLGGTGPLGPTGPAGPSGGGGSRTYVPIDLTNFPAPSYSNNIQGGVTLSLTQTFSLTVGNLYRITIGNLWNNSSVSSINAIQVSVIFASSGSADIFLGQIPPLSPSPPCGNTVSGIFKATDSQAKVIVSNYNTNPVQLWFVQTAQDAAVWVLEDLGPA